jgi:hypothetical protein
MKKVWKLVGIAAVVAILGVASLGAVAYAQADGADWPFDFGERFRVAVADILGISVEVYDNAVEEAQAQVLDEALAEGWLTEEQKANMQERMEAGPGMRGMERGFPGMAKGFMGRGGSSLVGVAADELPITLSELRAELEAGKSIADVASEYGVALETISDAYLAQLEETLAGAVEDGRLTQERADWTLEQATENLAEQLEATWEGFERDGFRRGGRPGPMPGFPGSSEGSSS